MAFWVGFVMLFSMMLYVSGNVFARYVLRNFFDIGGIPGMFEYVGVMVVPLICLSLSYGWHHGNYIVINILQKKLKGKLHWGFQFSFSVATLFLFSAVLCWGSFENIFVSLDFQEVVGTPNTSSPKWPWNVAFFVGFLFLVIRNILDIIAMIRTREVLPRDRNN
jgi:TRAP-type C4-dicarboxylate transport system permease small subunit